MRYFSRASSARPGRPVLKLFCHATTDFPPADISGNRNLNRTFKLENSRVLLSPKRFSANFFDVILKARIDSKMTTQAYLSLYRPELNVKAEQFDTNKQTGFCSKTTAFLFN